MIVALIPAAGKSSRMGRPKLSLPFRDSTVLEHVIRAFQIAGVAHVIVVIGPHVPELIPLAHRAGAAVCALPIETPDMRATVEAGLTWIASHHTMKSDDGWFLAPADHPCLETGVIVRLMGERVAHPEKSIFIPSFKGKRGHPALIAWKHVEGIRTLPEETGLNIYLRQHLNETVEVAVESSGVLVDLDTPEDYERTNRL